MTGLEGLKLAVRRPAEGSRAELYKKEGIIFKRIAVFKWDQKKQVYKVVNETPTFWEMKLSCPEFNAYINHLYNDMMDYHAKLADLRHEAEILEQLYNTVDKEPYTR